MLPVFCDVLFSPIDMLVFAIEDSLPVLLLVAAAVIASIVIILLLHRRKKK